MSDKWDFAKWGRGPAPDPTDRNRLAFISITGPSWGRGPLCGPGTPCASAAVPQRRGPHAGPCAAALSGGAAVCCCVTPHTRPPSLAAAAGNGKGATACGRWWGLPSGPLGRPTRPQRPAGRTPAHPGRRAAARPVHPPAGAGRGNVAAKAGPLWAPARSSWPPAVARGHPSAMQGQAPAGPLCGPCIAPPPCRLRRRCSGAARPPLCGGCGAVRPSGPALRAGVAARGPSLGVPPPSRAGAPAAGCCCSPCPCGGPQFERRPLGPRKRGLCPLCGRLGRKDTPAAAGNATPANATQGQDKPPAAGLALRSPAWQRRKQGRAAPVAAHPTPHTPPKERKVTKMTIREYAKSKNFKIVGKLTRHPEWEWEWDKFSGEKRRSGTKSYSDDGGTVYHISKKGICIVTPNDEII